MLTLKNWRTKHTAFRNMVNSARDPSAPQIPVQNPDYVTCPCCSRNFNSDSAARHIPICKDKAAKKVMERASTATGREREDKMIELRKRTAYKPPKPKTRAQ
jgi:zinc-finger of a C2HC-type